MIIMTMMLVGEERHRPNLSTAYRGSRYIMNKYP
jgi:hypothetical protein